MITMYQDDNGAEQEVDRGLSAFPENEALEITKVERTKRYDHRYIIYFGELQLSVHEDVMIKYRMTRGSCFTRAELEEIVIADERQRAYLEGLRYLGRKPRTAKEMARKLKDKEIAESIAAEVIQRLMEERLIDDPLYAKMWTEQRIRSHRKGKMWIRQELREKGIDKTVISEALDAVSPEEEEQSALELARKKWRSTRGEPFERKRKAGAFLMRRGYPGEMVRRVLGKVADEENAGDDEEWEELW